MHARYHDHGQSASPSGGPCQQSSEESGDHKSEAIFVSIRQLVETGNLIVGGVNIVSQRAVKCTGVMFDTRLSNSNNKTAETPKSLSRILLNTRGPKQYRRKLIASVVTSQVLYAAPVWAKAAMKPW